MGKFSVQNLFDGVKNVIDQALALQFKIFEALYIKLPQEVWKNLSGALKEPLFRPVIQILSLATNIYNVFGNEIKYIGKWVEKLPGDLVRLVEKAFGTIFKSKQKEVAQILVPWKKDARKILELIYQAPAAIKVIKNPKKLADYIRAPFDAYLRYLIKSAPRGNFVSGFIDTGLKTGDKVLSKSPVYVFAKKNSATIATVGKAVASNADGFVKAAKTAPKFFEAITPFLKIGGKSLKTLGKAIPIIGEFMQAVDQQYLENEIQNMRKVIDRIEHELTSGTNEVAREKQRAKLTYDRVTEMHNAFKAGKLVSGGAPIVDYSRITQIVKTNSQSATSKVSQADITAIAQATATRIPKPPTVAPVDYSRISSLMNQSVAPLKTQAAPVNLSPVLSKLAQIENKIPTQQQIAAQVQTNLTPLFKAPTPVDLTPIQSTLNGFNVSLGQIKSSVQTGNIGISGANVKLDSIQTRVAETATKPQLDQAETKIKQTTVTQGTEQKQAIVNDGKLTRAEIDKMRRESTIPSSVITQIANQSSQQTTAQLSPAINQAIQNARQASQNALNAAAYSQTAATEVNKVSEKTKEVYELVGGDALKAGLPVNQESQLLALGTQAFTGATNAVKTLPALLMAAQAVSHFRGGLHRVPATLPGSLTNPTVAPVRITDKLQHDQHLWKLTDEKIGAPTPVQTRLPNGSYSTSQSRNVHESLDTIQAQSTAIDQEIEILQQAVIKLASETLKINMIVLQDHSILESMRDFMGYRYTETKERVPTEISLGKDGLLSWLQQSSLYYVGTRMDQKFDLTQMMQKQYLEIGKVSSSFFERFDPADANAKVPGEKFSKSSRTEDDDEWKRYVKFATQTPSAVQSNTDPKVKIERYTNNDTVPIVTEGVILPQG